MSRANQLRPSSMTDSEKTAAPSVQATVTDEKKGAVETVAPAAGVVVDAAQPIVEEKTSRPNSAAEPTSDDDDNFEYPTKWRLTAITVALCLSVFCMALVSCFLLQSPVPRLWYAVDRQRLHLSNQPIRSAREYALTPLFRIIQSSQQLFLALQISSKRSTM